MKNRKRNRLLGYDYSSDNLYFITICIQNRVCCLGKVIRNESSNDVNSQLFQMDLNQFGQIVENRILWLAEQYKYVVLHNYVVMPNHVHAIIEINSSLVKDTKIKSLSQLVGAFKTTSSKHIHLAGYKEFKWQRSFHDNIIQNKRAFQNISNCIDSNPDKWQKDVFY
ncbi:MAG: transposase [Flavobacteriales bacterium]